MIMRLRQPLSALLLAALLLASGCTSLTDEERQWLTDRVRQQLVFVEGGTFRMGDVGTTDAEGYVSYFTGDSDTHRSEERRVGKECRSRWARRHRKVEQR